MKSNYLYAAGAALLLIILVFVFTGDDEESSGILVPVSSGEFLVDIVSTGELEAKNSVDILGPQGTRNYRIWNMTIQDIIDEGTYVKKGDYVATIDPTELTGKIKDSQLELEKIESQYIQTQLDTTLDMRKSRDELINLEYGLVEKQLVVDQSQYEPPATIRQAELDYEKAVRTFEQTKENYKIKRDQNIAKMTEVSLNKRKQLNSLEGMNEMMASFTITAPEDGMLIYKKQWNGTAIKEGSQISAWDPVVATLPDLSVMISVTYINEVDIRKVKAGQKVEIGLDAFPEKKFNGSVLKVANVGEQRPNSDAKVFKVTIEISERDELLRPSMTTSNRIITNSLDEVIYVPLESLYNQDDSITYVFLKRALGVTKQEVKLGESNRNFVIVESGLGLGDQVFLNKVAGMEDDEVDLLPELDGKRNEPRDTVEVKQPEEEKRKPGGKRPGGKKPGGKKP